ncbi:MULTISPECIES: hypothetical protein [unclassified Nocardiopsis]|uniref:hypothetical protein n=1 Tax=unclassified Nocardiopsis TaxID=2649073 RepID=UPI001F1C8D3F|nr:MULTISPECIES: hypothetical protein [unclassified Nocardiopsis]
MAHVIWRLSLLPMAGALAAAVVAAALGLAAQGVVLPVAVSDRPHGEQRIPVVELLCVCAATAGAWSTRPRLWAWERLGGARTRVRAAVVAAFGVGLPVAAGTAVVLTAAPPAENTGSLAANLLLGASAVYLLAPFAGAVPSGLTVLAGVLLGAAACNAVPGLNRVSPYAYAGTDGWVAPDLLAAGVVPALAAGAAVAALGAHALTRGATARASRAGEESG